MKKLFIILLVCAGTLTTHAQVLQGDAEGKTSILFHGKTLGIDLGKSSLSFGINNFTNEKIAQKDQRLVWGTSLSASNKESVAKLFDNSDFSTGFRATGIIGYSITMEDLPNMTAYDKALAELDKPEEKLNQDIVNLTKTKVTEVAREVSLNQTQSDALINEAVAIVEKKNREDYEKEFTKLDTKYSTGTRLKDISPSLQLYSRLKHSELESAIEKFNKQHKRLLDQAYRTYWKTRHTAYFSSSLGYDEYTFYNKDLTMPFKERFDESDNLSKEFLVGYNYERGSKYKLGISFGIHFTDNAEDLTKEEFRHEEIDLLNGQQTTRQIKKKEGYVGELETVTKFPINIDFLNFFNPESDRSLVVAWHSYFRQKFSGDEDVAQTTSTIGSGLYFFKQGGVFAGGFYLEAPDLANNIERAKPEPELKPVLQRLNFSIVGKFAFSSLLGY